MTEIPKPTETGSAGTQQAGTRALVTIAEESPLSGLPITQRVEGLAATRPRSMGGEVAASLLAGSFSQLSLDLQTTRDELKDTRGELKQTLNHLSDAKTRAAVFEERASAAERGRHVKNLSNTGGTVLIGIGIELYRNSLNNLGIIAGGLGFLFVFLGWFTPKGEAEK